MCPTLNTQSLVLSVGNYQVRWASSVKLTPIQNYIEHAYAVTYKIVYRKSMIKRVKWKDNVLTILPLCFWTSQASLFLGDTLQESTAMPRTRKAQSTRTGCWYRLLLVRQMRMRGGRLRMGVTRLKAKRIQPRCGCKRAALKENQPDESAKECRLEIYRTRTTSLYAHHHVLLNNVVCVWCY